MVCCASASSEAPFLLLCGWIKIYYISILCRSHLWEMKYMMKSYDEIDEIIWNHLIVHPLMLIYHSIYQVIRCAASFCAANSAAAANPPGHHPIRRVAHEHSKLHPEESEGSQLGQVPRGRTFPRKNSAQVKDKEKDWSAFTCVYLCVYIYMYDVYEICWCGLNMYTTGGTNSGSVKFLLMVRSLLVSV